MPLHVPDRDKPLKYRELRSKLQKNGVVEVKKRGKGAHRMFLKIIEGRPVVDFVTCHSEGHEISRKLEFYKFSLPLPLPLPPFLRREREREDRIGHSTPSPFRHTARRIRHVLWRISSPPEKGGRGE